MRSFPVVLASFLFAAGCGDPTISYGVIHPDLSGTVTIEGKPAPGITIVATRGGVENTVQTNANGHYTFGPIPRGWSTISVRGLPDFIAVDHPAQYVELGKAEVVVDFTGYAPIAISGHVLWRYGSDQFMGISGVSVHVDQPPFAVGDVVSATDGSYRFPRVPGVGQFTVVLGALPAGMTYVDTDRWIYGTQIAAPARLRDTAWVGYRPSAGLRVDVMVDGTSYSGAVVHLATPIPVTDAPRQFVNLPVMPVEVSISGFPSSITFDATVKMVNLTAAGAVVTFIGYSKGANRPPVATIIAPANGATFTAGAAITFRGTASDPEDGALTGNALDWIDSGRGGDLGSGEVLAVSTLPVGPHHISLRATDSGGSEHFTSIDITIVPATGGRVAGTIRVGSDRTYDAHLSLSTTPARTAITDLQGQFAFENVPAGTYTITLQPVECAEFSPTSRSIKVEVGATTVVDFTGVSLYCYDYGIAPGSKPVRRPPRPPEGDSSRDHRGVR